MKKKIDILIIEDFTGERIDVPDHQLLDTGDSEIIITKIHIPDWLGESTETGIHVNIVKDVVET
ncbi:hypothetical protein HS7_19120 [Sulfolobales archaeon HS-7]|nr:hypothetical protein HS7_19120 [Sulfolobales archaeon HS-7]